MSVLDDTEVKEIIQVYIIYRHTSWGLLDGPSKGLCC